MRPYHRSNYITLIRLFDDVGEGYITVETFRQILREIDPTITEEELEGIISEVGPTFITAGLGNLFHISG